MVVNALQSRAAIATIEHDLKVGNIEHARRIGRELFDWQAGDIMQATPDELRQACRHVKKALKEMDL